MKNINIYAGYRYPPKIISHAVWLYHRFTLSFRDIEELLAARGIAVSYETIRNWCEKFGQRYCSPIRIVTDKLRSYSAAKKELISSVEHSSQRYENNRCELSHQPSQQQERQMRKFKSQRQAQRFLCCHGVVNNLFRLGRHLMSAKNYRFFRERAFNE
jgi:transposase-like protein